MMIHPRLHAIVAVRHKVEAWSLGRCEHAIGLQRITPGWLDTGLMPAVYLPTTQSTQPEAQHQHRGHRQTCVDALTPARAYACGVK